MSWKLEQMESGFIVGEKRLLVRCPGTPKLCKWSLCTSIWYNLSILEFHIFYENHPPLLFLSALAFAAICASSSLIFLIVASRLYSITRFSLKYFICGVLVSHQRQERRNWIPVFNISAPILYVPNSLHNPFHILRFLSGISVGPRRHASRRLIYRACLNIRRKDLWIRSIILGHSDRVRYNHHP